MVHVRSSLANLLAAVTVAAASLLALRNADPAWSRIVLSAAMAGIGVGWLGVVFHRRHARAFAGGFAISGTAYLSIVLGTNLHDRLVTTDVFNYLYERLRPTVPPHVSDDPATITIWLKREGGVRVSGQDTTDDELAEVLDQKASASRQEPLQVYFDPGVTRARIETVIDAALPLEYTRLHVSENHIAPDPEASAQPLF